MGLIFDISSVLASTLTSTNSINARTTADGFFLVRIEIFVPDAGHLNTVMRKLSQISGVMTVERVSG